MSSDKNQNLEYAILSNLEVESQQITNLMTENSSNNPDYNYRHTSFDVDLSQPNTIFDEFSNSEDKNHQIINLENNRSNIIDHIHRQKSFDDNSFQMNNILNDEFLCSKRIKNYQTKNLDKNASNNKDYNDGHKSFDNVSYQPNQILKKLLSSNAVKNYQSLYLDENVSNNKDNIDCHRRFDNISSQPNQKINELLCSTEVQNGQTINVENTASNTIDYNDGHKSLANVPSQPTKTINELLCSSEVQNGQTINLENTASNTIDYNDGHKSLANVPSQPTKTINELLCSTEVQNGQTTNLDKNASNNKDYNDCHKSLANVPSQPTKTINELLCSSEVDLNTNLEQNELNYTDYNHSNNIFDVEDAMLPNNNDQVTNSDKNILDSNYRHARIDDDLSQPNISNTLLSKPESCQTINDGIISGDSDSCHKLKSFNYDSSQLNKFDAILPSGKVQSQPITNLKTNSSIDTDFNSKYKSFESVLSVEDTNSEMKHLNSSNMHKNDKVVKFSLHSLGEAFIDCMYESRNNVSSNGDYILNKLLEKSKDKYSTLKEPQNLKRKLEEIEDINTNNQIQKLKSSSRSNIAVSLPKIDKNKSAKAVPNKNSLGRFTQDNICLCLPPDIDRCVECNITLLERNLTRSDHENIQCRFYAFRELTFSNSGKMVIAGFPDPFKNVSNVDQDLWTPNQYSFTPSNFNIQASIKILEDVGGQLCKLIKDEQEALQLNLSEKKDNKNIIWKKNIKGIRELCDVCQTTIFNYHWSCLTCGFVVCVDCIRYKLGRNKPSTGSIMFKQDNPIWFICTNRKEHQFDQLTITQILTNDSLNYISLLMHNVSIVHNIPLNCNCISIPKHSSRRSFFYSLFKNLYFNVILKAKFKCNSLYALCVLAFLKGYEGDDSYDDDDDGFKDDNNWENDDDDCYEDNKNVNCNENVYYNEKSVHKLTIINETDSNISHRWLCDGLLLQLLDSDNSDNYELFQEQWRRGQPVLVSGVGKRLKKSLWHPESFSRDFGDQINDLINCSTGKVVSNQPMSKFWDGFENGDKRLHDNNGQSMMLKLKDWPQSEDFAKRLPDRFEDLMNCLPLKEYTQRDGRFNLASRLPECFVRPDLGPKMYIAYGNAGTRHKLLSTTNLHLDMSDAINVMVYVAITKNCFENNHEWYIREALDVIEDSGCDLLTKKRVYEDQELPGALWHIYHADEADSIRDLLHKIDVEQGVLMEERTDPIHDQTHYLDKYHRERLFREYGIKGYTIIQCAGDAVFIPAGAPHQVRNLHNCIKVAEDFVSPENIHQSFRMTQEFRNLTDYHTNHEDKLQLKNIVFHAVKDSISVLKHIQNA